MTPIKRINCFSVPSEEHATLVNLEAIAIVRANDLPLCIVSTLSIHGNLIFKLQTTLSSLTLTVAWGPSEEDLCILASQFSLPLIPSQTADLVVPTEILPVPSEPEEPQEDLPPLPQWDDDPAYWALILHSPRPEDSE